MSIQAKTTNTATYAENFRAALRTAGGDTTTVEESVARHKVPEHKLSMPVEMTYSKGAKVLSELATADQEEQEFSRTFKFRPWDGAVALYNVMKDVFGTTGRGLSIQSFFGSQPPQIQEVEVAYGETIQVPWGRIAFEPFEGVINTDGVMSDEYGALFRLEITAKKKYAKEVEIFFRMIQEYLEENSIYKGSYIKGTDYPTFLAPYTDPSMTYNNATEELINTWVWGVLRNSGLLKSSKLKIDPKILLHGPYGTGKSELGRLTAQKANDEGWTFISFDSGKSTLNDLERTLQTARLLSPAVVMVEDIDIFMDDNDDRKTSQLLDMIDGVSSKGHEVMVLMTTNHLGKLTKGSVRSGRINKMIEIGYLDQDATTRLIDTVCGHLTEDNLDYDAIYDAVKDYEPAFIRQTFDDAKQAAIIHAADKLRQGGQEVDVDNIQFRIGTQDFINAANVLRTQHQLFAGKQEPEKVNHLEVAMGDLVRKSIMEIGFSNDQIGTIDLAQQN